jgi:hypothetical protein
MRYAAIAQGGATNTSGRICPQDSINQEIKKVVEVFSHSVMILPLLAIILDSFTLLDVVVKVSI